MVFTQSEWKRIRGASQWGSTPSSLRSPLGFSDWCMSTLPFTRESGPFDAGTSPGLIVPRLLVSPTWNSVEIVAVLCICAIICESQMMKLGIGMPSLSMLFAI